MSSYTERNNKSNSQCKNQKIAEGVQHDTQKELSSQTD